MNPKRAVCAVLLAVAVAIVYALSPLTVWFAIFIVPAVLLGTRGLDADERRWVTGLLIAAIALRLLVIAASLSRDRSLASAVRELFRRRGILHQAVALAAQPGPRHSAAPFRSRIRV